MLFKDFVKVLLTAVFILGGIPEASARDCLVPTAKLKKNGKVSASLKVKTVEDSKSCPKKGFDLSALKGEKGDTGSKGDTGVKGDTGPAGDVAAGVVICFANIGSVPNVRSFGGSRTTSIELVELGTGQIVVNCKGNYPGLVDGNVLTVVDAVSEEDVIISTEIIGGNPTQIQLEVHTNRIPVTGALAPIKTAFTIAVIGEL